MKLKKSLILVGTPLIIFVLILVCFQLQSKSTTFNDINKNLDVGEIKLGMPERAVTQYWGQGELINGFGGHRREYIDMKIKVEFSDDRDNDLYQKVGSLEFTNTNYSIFLIKVGDEKNIAMKKILSNGFKPMDNAQDIFVKGEFYITFTFTDQRIIESIQIAFVDKDLRNRSY